MSYNIFTKALVRQNNTCFINNHEVDKNCEMDTKTQICKEITE